MGYLVGLKEYLDERLKSFQEEQWFVLIFKWLCVKNIIKTTYYLGF